MNGFVVISSLVVLGFAVLWLGLLSDRATRIAKIAIALPAAIYFVSIAPGQPGDRFVFALTFAILALVVAIRAARELFMQGREQPDESG